MYKRLQPLREAELTDGAEACQAALSLTADATAASHTEAEADAEASQLCFNGGQVGLHTTCFALASACCSTCLCKTGAVSS